MIEKGQSVENKGGKLFFKFNGKILGSGSLSSPAVIEALEFSERASEKIRAAGGSPVVSGKEKSDAPAAQTHKTKGS